MKTRHTIFLLTLTIWSLATIGLSAQDAGELLVGNWKLDNRATMDNISPFGKAHLDSIPAELRTKIEDSYNDRKMVFSEDGAFEQVLADGHTVEADWKVTDEGATLVLTDPHGNEHVQSIVKLDSSTLVLRPANTEGRKPIVPELHFKKQ